MTAINCFIRTDRAFMLTDALAYNLDGEAMGIYQKCFPMAHLGAAVATRGTAIWTSLVAGAFSIEAESFDALVSEGGEIAERIYRDCRELDYSGTTALQIVVAGWSEARQRMECHALNSEPRDGHEAWQFFRGEDITLAPEPSAAALNAFGLRGKPIEDLDPRSDGVALLNAQRAMRFSTAPDCGDVSVHVVGGYALLTEVTPEAVTQSILHRWQDRVGELVKPDVVIGREHSTSLLEELADELDEESGDHHRPVSRHERRAAARFARHGGGRR